MMPTANVTVSASSPDAACVEVAPTARSPATTTTNDDVKPTSAVTMPATIGSLFAVRSGVVTTASIAVSFRKQNTIRVS